MAFPAVVARNSGSNAYGTSQVINLPPGIVSGDLLIICAAFYPATPTLTWPAGWTVIFNTANTERLEIAYRHADGTEGTSITVTASASVYGGYTDYLVSGASTTTAPEVSAAATGNSANPAPAPLTPTWGAADTLWLAVEGSGFNTVTTYPAGFVNGLVAGINGDAATGSAELQANTATESPGTFTIGGLGAWVAATVGIQPAGPPPVNWHPWVTSSGWS